MTDQHGRSGHPDDFPTQRGVFTVLFKSGDTQSAQMIFATHSDHIALYGDLQAQTGNSGIQAIDSYIESQPEYSATRHEKIDTTHGHYKTWPTYIRNAIDHPDSGRSYSETDMALSIELLRALCKRHRGTP